jgi:hypothetical protein
MALTSVNGVYVDVVQSGSVTPSVGTLASGVTATQTATIPAPGPGETLTVFDGGHTGYRLSGGTRLSHWTQSGSTVTLTFVGGPAAFPPTAVNWVIYRSA